MSPKLRITLAGNVIIEVEGRRLPDQTLGPRSRVVLACLVLERDRLVPADELADAAWGHEPPSTWRPALRGVIARVRRYLELPRADGAVTLRSGLGCYQLTLPEDTEVDIERAIADYEAARATLEAGEYTQALDLARSSVTLCKNEFLPGAKGAWVEGHQSRLRNLRLAALEVLAEAASACGEWGAAHQAAEDILAQEVYRESAYVLLMKALAGAGNVTEALLTYQRCCEVLERDLGSSPCRATRDAFLTVLNAGATDAGDEASRRRTNIPVSTSPFVGRTEQIVALRTRLVSCRLLTLTGTAGVGKSRLAVEVARPLAPTFPDGVWLIELAEVNAAVVQHVSSVLRLPDAPGHDPVASLCGHLAGKQMLLVLDNCEHVIADCAALVSRVLRSAEGVRILATSREPLHVSGEVTWTVEPLSLPPCQPMPETKDLFAYEAVQLFADRASSARPGIDIDLRAAAHLCARLDGIPLAIELAAARARVFTIQELSDLLADQRELLTGTLPHGTGARHQSLAAALDWSYELLDDDERTLLRRLSVFASGFTATAVEAVCAEAGFEVLTALASLVDKSLVLPRHDQTTRFRLLETVRTYARAKLAVACEEHGVQSRLLHWAADVAGEAGADVLAPSEAAVLDRLDEEQGNLRAGLEWSMRSGQEERGLQLALALTRYWEIRGYLGEGRAWLERLAGCESISGAGRAAALNAAGVLANDQSDYSAARALHSEALILRRSLGDPRTVAASLNGLANVSVSAGDLHAALPMFEEVLRIGRECNDRHTVAACLVNLAVVTEHALAGGLDWPHSATDAREWLWEGLSIRRAMGDLQGVALSLENLGVLSALESDKDRAQSCFRQCLDLYRRLGDKKGVAGTVRFLGQLSYGVGDYDDAKELLEECLALEQELGSAERTAEALAFLGAIAERAGRFHQARNLYQRSLGTYAMASNPGGAEDVLGRLLKLEPLSPGAPTADSMP